jgi:hypothetical protein
MDSRLTFFARLEPMRRLALWNVEIDDERRVRQTVEEIMSGVTTI